MPILAVRAARILRTCAVALKNVVPLREKLQVKRIAAQIVLARMVNCGNVPAYAFPNRAKYPCVHETVNIYHLAAKSSLSVPSAAFTASPIPAAGRGIANDFGEQPINLFVSEMADGEITDRCGRILGSHDESFPTKRRCG